MLHFPKTGAEYQTHRMVGAQMEQVRGEDSWSEEAQEDETADRCVSHVLVN